MIKAQYIFTEQTNGLLGDREDYINVLRNSSTKNDELKIQSSSSSFFFLFASLSSLAEELRHKTIRCNKARKVATMKFGEGGVWELKVQCQSLDEPRQVSRREAKARLGKL